MQSIPCQLYITSSKKNSFPFIVHCIFARYIPGAKSVVENSIVQLNVGVSEYFLSFDESEGLNSLNSPFSISLKPLNVMWIVLFSKTFITGFDTSRETLYSLANCLSYCSSSM